MKVSNILFKRIIYYIIIYYYINLLYINNLLYIIAVWVIQKLKAMLDFKNHNKGKICSFTAQISARSEYTHLGL